MGVILVFLFTVIYVAVVIRYLWGKVKRHKLKNAKETNPYINIHKGKIKNDQNYDAYLKWMEKEGHGVPMDKVVSREDARADKKIKNML